ncbi:MAG: hypothetical protein AABY86_10815 [Bdellovibrionota bacterium]
MNKTILLDFFKKNWLSLTSAIIAVMAIIISLGFNAKMLEERFQVKIKEEVKMEIKREMDTLTQNSQAFTREELSKTETKIAEIEKALSDLNQRQTDSDGRSTDISTRVADLQTKLDDLEQKLNKIPAPVIASKKTNKANGSSKKKSKP